MIKRELTTVWIVAIVAAVVLSVFALIMGIASVRQSTGLALASPSNYCSDSDGGLNYFVKGTACLAGRISPGGQCYADYCINNFTLKEYYCANGTIGNFNYICQFGCVNGACIQGNQTHSVCSGNNTCAVVQGPGTNECNSNIDCNPQHLACVNNACQLVNGPGSNLCSNNSQCQNNTNQTHLACSNNLCQTIQGPGNNQCQPAGSPCGNVTFFPDLFVSTIIVNTGNATNGTHNVAINGLIFNGGQGAAGSSFTRFTVNPTGQQHDVLTNPITNGGSQYVPTVFILSNGFYSVTVTADVYNGVPESNENNNILTASFNVTG